MPKFRAIKISVYFIRGTTRPSVRGNYHESSDCFEYPKNSHLNQATRNKNTCQNFPTKKIPKSKTSNPKKILRSWLSLQIRSTPPPPPHPPTLFDIWWKKFLNWLMFAWDFCVTSTRLIIILNDAFRPLWSDVSQPTNIAWRILQLSCYDFC